MSKLCDWLRHHGLGPSSEVREALDGSRERREQAADYRAEMAERAKPLRQALRRNHFEQAVVAVFEQARGGRP